MLKFLQVSFVAMVVLICSETAVAQQENNTITATVKPFKGKRVFYIVRHAEKETGSDPAISAVGRQRAGDLHRVLLDKKVDLIMASQYRRTGMTADSVRIYRKVDSIQYKADVNGDEFLKTLEARSGKAKHILVVGHSNTLPGIIRKLGVSSYTPKELPETEYSNLFIVEIKKGKATLTTGRYGAL
jgi:phosphohistidine phosphatase SixA